jgi:hypothetical protein
MHPPGARGAASVIARKEWPAWLIAAVAAALVPALGATALLLAQGGSRAVPHLWTAFSLALWIALAHAVPFGIPAAWLLQRRGRLRLWPLVACGALIGALGSAAWNWPVQFGDARPSVWINGQQTLSAGVPTAAGWWIYAEAVLTAGVLGALGGAAFLAAFRFARRAEQVDAA